MHDTPYHIPVLVQEVLHYLDIKPKGLYVDATFGGGGHTRAILESEPTCKVIAVDWDQIALEKNGESLLQEFPDRLSLAWGNFAQLDKLLEKNKIKQVDGVLADFGTSQYQLFERPGFSFYHDTPLDMRMSPAHQKVTAAELLNKASVELLIEILRSYGEEPKAKSIANAIVEYRTQQRFTTTKQLAQLIEKTIGYKQGKKIHPATKTFQAIRIYINQELQNINSFLHAATRIIKPSGRLVCISFHSLEDRIVKEFFRNPDIKERRLFDVLTPKVVTASTEEVAINPASRSAKLRAIEFL